jgi:hypothetical protein
MPAPIDVPPASFLGHYAISGAYTDCYETTIPGTVSLPELIESFYTTPLFKVERWILAKAISRPSTDQQAHDLGHGQTDVFAAWTVEKRSDTEILLDAGRTRSWLSVIPVPKAASTRLLFGSAVVPKQSSGSLGFGFEALLGFHRLYARMLLSAAAGRLVANHGRPRAA